MLVILVAFLPSSLGAIGLTTAIGLVAAGLLGLLGYLTYYRALEYGGAVGLVSAISATYGGITTLLAVVVLGDRLSWRQLLGVTLSIAGLVLIGLG